MGLPRLWDGWSSALVKDPTHFELVTTLYGFEPRGIRTIYRYREAGRP